MNDALLSQWKTLAQKELRGESLDALTKDTAEGIALKALYTDADLAPYKAQIEIMKRGDQQNFLAWIIRIISPKGLLPRYRDQIEIYIG